MTKKNAQDWLNENYPLNEICKRESDHANKGKKRSEIHTLIINKESIEENIELTGTLKLEGFTKLEGLNCSSHSLESLDLSDCRNLLVVDCKNNNLKVIKLENCSNLENLDISRNKDLKELNLSSNLELKTVNINNCSSIISNKVKVTDKLKFNNEKYCFEKHAHLAQITDAKDQVRNILIIGWTGNGKSNLANCLTDSNQFISRNSSVSITGTYKKSDVFEYNGNKYCIIDNIGFGDTRNLTKRDLLYKIAEGIHSSREGINQILFVVKERFTDNHIEAFKTFESLINQTEITKFTTIVRTNFNDYRSSEKVVEDKLQLISNNTKVNDLIQSCNDIIYINAPSIPIINDNDDEDEKFIKELEIKEANEKREESKEIIFNHLTNNCNLIYKLKGWDSVYDEVSSHFERIKNLEDQLNNENFNNLQIRREISNERNQVTAILEENPVNIFNSATGAISMIAGIIQAVKLFI